MVEKGQHRIDTTTGLPSVSPSQFWRVSPYYHGEYSFYAGDMVQLVEVTNVTTKWLKKEKKVERVRATARISDNTTKETILEAACAALDDYNARQVRNSLMGTYPPKSIN